MIFSVGASLVTASVTLANQAGAHASAGRYREASLDYDRLVPLLEDQLRGEVGPAAMETKNRLIEALVGRARAAFHYGNLSGGAEPIWHQSAFSDVERVLQAFKVERAAVYALRGRLQIARGRFGEARLDLETAARLDPDLAEGWKWLGLVKLNEGESAAAVPDLEKAVRLNPHDEQARTFLGLAQTHAVQKPKGEGS